MRLRWTYMVPAVVFGLIGAGFYFGLGLDAMVLPSPLINEEVPQFALPPVGHGDGFSSADLKGQVSLVNAFASWCAPCREEQPALNALAATKRVPIYGIDYKDKSEAALAWIGAFGDPYVRIGAATGDAGIAWGIYGVPETFLVDRTGRIRYKHVGPLSDADIERTILPLVERLQQ